MQPLKAYIQQIYSGSSYSTYSLVYEPLNLTASQWDGFVSVSMTDGSAAIEGVTNGNACPLEDMMSLDTTWTVTRRIYRDDACTTLYATDTSTSFLLSRKMACKNNFALYQKWSSTVSYRAALLEQIPLGRCAKAMMTSSPEPAMFQMIDVSPSTASSIVASVGVICEDACRQSTPPLYRNVTLPSLRLSRIPVSNKSPVFSVAPCFPNGTFNSKPETDVLWQRHSYDNWNSATPPADDFECRGDALHLSLTKPATAQFSQIYFNSPSGYSFGSGSLMIGKADLSKMSEGMQLYVVAQDVDSTYTYGLTARINPFMKVISRISFKQVKSTAAFVEYEHVYLPAEDVNSTQVDISVSPRTLRVGTSLVSSHQDGPGCGSIVPLNSNDAVNRTLYRDDRCTVYYATDSTFRSSAQSIGTVCNKWGIYATWTTSGTYHFATVQQVPIGKCVMTTFSGQPESGMYQRVDVSFNLPPTPTPTPPPTAPHSSSSGGSSKASLSSESGSSAS